MILSIIVAMDERRGIGKDDQLPWHLPGDLARFKKITMGHHLILGRKTYQSIGRPLPGRKMIVLSQNPDFKPEGSLKADSLPAAMDLARERGEVEVFVIGGGEIYRQVLPQTDRLYLTRVKAVLETDTYFPEWNEDNWVQICSQDFSADDRNPYRFSFHYLIRSAT